MLRVGTAAARRFASVDAERPRGRCPRGSAGTIITICRDTDACWSKHAQQNLTTKPGLRTALTCPCRSQLAGEALRLDREQAPTGQVHPATLQPKVDKASPLSTLRLLIAPTLLRGRAAWDFDRFHAPRWNGCCSTLCVGGRRASQEAVPRESVGTIIRRRLRRSADTISKPLSILAPSERRQTSCQVGLQIRHVFQAYRHTDQAIANARIGAVFR